MRSNGGPALRPNGFVLVSSRRLRPAAFSRAINEHRRRLTRLESVMSEPESPPGLFGSVLIHSCAIERHVPQTLLGVQIGKDIAALLGPTMNCAAASSKRAVVLCVPLRLQVSAGGVAAIFSTSTPQGNEQDAQQGSYQSPQNEQAADAKLGIAGRWQNQQRGQYQGQQAKGCIACHWLHFSQRQRGRALSHLGCISHTASGSQRAGDLLPGSLCLSPAMRP